jgi:hypothetical protein
MQIKQETLTPAKAAGLLKINKCNRTVRPAHVAKLIRAIENGEWNPNDPSPIAINGKELVTGQHRCLAVVESGIAVRLWVARGVPVSARATMDTGLPLSVTDQLKMQGEEYAPQLAGILRQIWLYETEGYLGGKCNPMKAPTGVDLIRLLEKHPAIREIAGMVGRANVHTDLRGVGSPALTGGAYWVLSQVDEEDAKVFFLALTTGGGLESGDPILALRRMMTESRRKPNARVLGACMIKAWNAWREGEDVYLLAWRGGGSSPEPFPKVY